MPNMVRSGLSCLAIAGSAALLNAPAAAQTGCSVDDQDYVDCKATQPLGEAFNAAFDDNLMHKIWNSYVCAYAKQHMTEDAFVLGLTANRQPMGAITSKRTLVGQGRATDPQTGLSSYYRTFKFTSSNFSQGIYEMLSFVKEGDRWRVCNYNFVVAPPG